VNFLLHTLRLPAPSSPIIVKLIDEPRDPTGLAGVLIGALGLTGALTLLAVMLGLALGGLMFWLRSRSA
jgi:hypothetical protein